MKKLTKSDLICYVLLKNPGFTRVEVMERVYLLTRNYPEGVRQGNSYHIGFRPQSNTNYWLINHSTALGRPRRHPCASDSSVIRKGLVAKVGKRGNSITYDLTEKGLEVGTAAWERLTEVRKVVWNVK
jgi:hypothetical protein